MERKLTIEVRESSTAETIWDEICKICQQLSIIPRKCLTEQIAKKIHTDLEKKKLAEHDRIKCQEAIARLKRKINIHYNDEQIEEKRLLVLFEKIENIKSIKDSTVKPISTFTSLNSEPSDNPDFFKQSSLFMPPFGSDHLYGWNINSGNGGDINCFIIDTTLNPNSDIPINIYNDLYAEGDHGTYIATIIGSRNNTDRYVGIVPDSTLYYSDDTFNFEQVFLYGKEGDVVNISLASYAGGVEGPIVGQEEYRDYIYLASMMGITTCYGAANAGINLDEVYVENEGYIYNKNSADYVNPYGICVSGGGIVYDTWSRTYNFGSIVDVFALSSFEGSSGTSFASPRIAGFVAQLQSIYHYINGEYLDPLFIRELISASETGILPQKSISDTDHAVMPVMKLVLNKLGITADSSYPENYAVNPEDIIKLQSSIDDLFSGSSHENIATNLDLEQLISVDGNLEAFPPSKAKADCMQLFLKAVELFSTKSLPFLVQFSDIQNDWTFYGTIEQTDDEGLTISSQNGSILGALYRQEVPLSFNKKYSLELNADVISANSSPTVIIGNYMPGLDTIIDPELTKTFSVNPGNNTITMQFESTFGFHIMNFPGFGFKGVDMVKIKSLKLQLVD